jgi:hypothetical protein
MSGSSILVVANALRLKSRPKIALRAVGDARFSVPAVMEAAE